MNYIASFPISFHKQFLFMAGIAASCFLLLFYIIFIYFSAQMSYALDSEGRVFIKNEQAYQEEEQLYFGTLERFHSTEELRELGFTKIASPVFLSRTTSVTLRNQ